MDTKKYISSPAEYVEINTVDAFQGREKDIIVFSCVRSSKEKNLGFVSDYRRMNVAITRAKHCLFVVGNAETLQVDKNWKALIDYSKDKASLSHFDKLPKSDDLFHKDEPAVSQPLPKPAITIDKPKPPPPSEKPKQLKNDWSGVSGKNNWEKSSSKWDEKPLKV